MAIHDLGYLYCCISSFKNKFMKRMVKDIMMGADPILPDEPLTSDQEKQVHQGVFDQLDSINIFCQPLHEFVLET